MAMNHSVAGHWNEDYDEAALARWASALRASLEAPEVSLGLVFAAPNLFEVAAEILEILRVHARVPLLCGCSSNGLICGGEELEGAPGLVLSLHYFPGARLRACRFTQEDLEAGSGAAHWQKVGGAPVEEVNGWLVFADPFKMDSDLWLRQWSQAYAPRPVAGGLASCEPGRQTTQVYLNGEVFEEGGVAIALGGAVHLASVISQGCTPIGETWTVTKVERNLIHEIGNRPAYQVLVDTLNGLSAEEQELTQGNLFIGTVINEYLEDFHRGDFLIRNLLGADPQKGCIAIGDLPRPGQTIQFQRRDAASASEDMEALLERARLELAGRTVYGGCLCVCNGRGRHLFGAPNHDAALVRRKLGLPGLSGFFCNGEIGPVGERNFLHGYTAALALFVGP